MVNYDPLLPSFQTNLPTPPSIGTAPLARRHCACSSSLNPADGIGRGDRCGEHCVKHPNPQSDQSQQRFQLPHHRSPRQNNPLPPHRTTHNLRPSSASSSSPGTTREPARLHSSSVSGPVPSTRPAEDAPAQGSVKIEEDELEPTQALTKPPPPPHVSQPTHTQDYSGRAPYVSSNTYDRPQASFQSSYQRGGEPGGHNSTSRRSVSDHTESSHHRPLLPSRSSSPLVPSPDICDCDSCNRSSQSPIPHPGGRDGEAHGRSVRWGDGYDRRESDTEMRDTREYPERPMGEGTHYNDRERPPHPDDRYPGPDAPNTHNLNDPYYVRDPHQAHGGWHEPPYGYRQDPTVPPPHYPQYANSYPNPHQSRYHPYGAQMSSAAGPSGANWPTPPSHHAGLGSPAILQGTDRSLKHKSRKTWTEVEWKKLMDLAERSKRGDPRNDIDWEFVTLGFGGKRCRQGILTVAAKRGLKVSTREARTISKRALSSEGSNP